MQHLQPNSTLQGGKYKIEKVLGQGGFGITYLAEHCVLRRKVAIKEFFMKEHCNRDEGTFMVSVGSVRNLDLVERFKEKFLKEARLIADMDNHHIVRVFDAFEENGTAYYVMEHLDSGCLNDMLSHVAFSEDTALKFTRQIADALGYIHERNVLHLDVKPANILLRRNGDAVLIDFGISKRYDDEGGQTSTTPTGISKGYAPLEQYNQGMPTFSPCTDIYSLGATMFKMVTGDTPPEASIVNEDGLPTKPNTITDSTWNAIAKAMCPRRKDRPQSIEEWLSMLDFSNNKEEQKEALRESLSYDESTMLVDRPMQYVGNSKLDKEEDATVLVNNHNADVVDLGLSVKWCTCNLGATIPLSHGNFFILSSLKDFDNESANGLRLPTKEEWNELIDKCERKWIDSNFVEFRGINGETLALPVCGRLYDNEQDQLHETAFYWAAPNKYENKLWFVRMTEKEASANNVIARTKTNVAMSIRLVQDK